MAEFASLAHLGLAVMMDVAIFVGEQRGDVRDAGADQVAHRDGQRPGRGAAERQAGDGADMIRELAGDRTLDRPMAAIVDPRRHLVEHRALRPGEEFQGQHADIIQPARDLARQRLGLGGRPAPYAAVSSRDELERALARIGAPAILKTRRFGYDGKGQARIRDAAGADAAWDAVRGAPCVLEGFIRFDAEFSILLCRAASGDIALWDAPENVHANGILDHSKVPASPALRSAIAEAEALACQVADRLDYVGVLTLEFFAGAEGAVFNEMAPRVHNSGHWTIEGALTSQFENHIRAICGLPLGATDLVVPEVTMQNLIGADVVEWQAILGDPAAHLHLYGKGEARRGRKMGHVTRLGGMPDGREQARLMESES